MVVTGVAVPGIVRPATCSEESRHRRQRKSPDKNGRPHLAESAVDGAKWLSRAPGSWQCRDRAGTLPVPPMPPPVVIVGAGSSGCVLANRLSEKADREVLLLESGPDYAAASVPRDLLDGTRNSMRAHDWGYRHKPTARAPWTPLPRGRVVGGSSAVNTCIALRGQPEDYDEWAALGLPEWTFDACLPAFRKLERDLDFGGEPYHGNAGPLPVRRHGAAEL